MSALTIILIIIVILILFTYFYHMYKTYKTSKRKREAWPPVGTPLQCPDFWVNKGNGVCQNPFLLGTGEGGSPNSLPIKNFMSMSGCAGRKTNDLSCRKAKCIWARSTNNPWFGVQPKCKAGQNCYCPA